VQRCPRHLIRQRAYLLLDQEPVRRAHLRLDKPLDAPEIIRCQLTTRRGFPVTGTTRARQHAPERVREVVNAMTHRAAPAGMSRLATPQVPLVRHGRHGHTGGRSDQVPARSE
jgi:hypothetical protein